MDLEDFGLMCKGYFEKRKRDELNFANIGFIIDAFASGLSGQRPNYKRFIDGWFGEGATNRVDMSTSEGVAKVSAEIERRLKLNNQILEEVEKVVERKRYKNAG